MKFINRNAYIIVGIKGYAYCPAALRAVKLIVNNALRLAAVNIIGDALIFLGKLTVVAACGCIAFAMTLLPMFAAPDSESYLSSPLVPVVLTCLAAYVVASIFFGVRRRFWQLTRSKSTPWCSWPMHLRAGARCSVSVSTAHAGSVLHKALACHLVAAHCSPCD